jgi:hypothetical protein
MRLAFSSDLLEKNMPEDVRERPLTEVSKNYNEI